MNPTDTPRPLTPLPRFLLGLLRNFAAAAILVGGSLLIGATGYHVFEGLGWLDSLYTAAMILTTMGPTGELHHAGAKVFAICYALFSAMVFLSVITIMLTPVAHRVLHRFHLESRQR